MCLGDREAPFVQGEAGKGNGRTMGEHGLVLEEKQPGAGSSQELPTLTHTLTGFHVSSQSIPQPPHHPPQRYSATQAAQSHLLHTSPGAFPPSHARPAHTAHTCEGARRKKKKKKALGSPQHCLDPSSMPLFHRHHLPLRSACKRASISSPSSRLGPRSRGNLCLLGLAFPLRCALLYLLGSAHKHQLCITGDE